MRERQRERDRERETERDKELIYRDTRFVYKFKEYLG
jgi:hypothetical protein